jgi:glycosyltransferase involved in cell wall biosynthesis
MSPISEPAASPQVSVLMLTHNHARYIEQAIASVRGQTLFRHCELLIGEDASTDATAGLCEQERCQEPEHIQVLSSPGGALGFHRNFARLLDRARGRYVAFLEGDDWWCDSTKLEIQMALLERSPHLAFCGTRTRVHDQRAGASAPGEPPLIGPPAGVSELGLNELIHGYSFHFSSVLMRRSAVQLPAWIFEQYCLDRPLYLLAARHGRAGVIDAITSVYRLHDGGVWAPLSPLDRARRSRDLFAVLERSFTERPARQFRQALSGILWGYLAEALQRGDLAQARAITLMAIRASPRQRLLHQPRLTASALLQGFMPRAYQELRRGWTS